MSTPYNGPPGLPRVSLPPAPPRTAATAVPDHMLPTLEALNRGLPPSREVTGC